MHEYTQAVPRPIWRDEFFQDLPALEKYAAEMRAWQRQSGDPFGRADIALAPSVRTMIIHTEKCPARKRGKREFRYADNATY